MATNPAPTPISNSLCLCLSCKSSWVLLGVVRWMFSCSLVRYLAAVELATLEWVAWYNHQRLLGSIGYIPPAQADELYHRTHSDAVPMNAVL